jgi:hypothetical protein
LADFFDGRVTPQGVSSEADRADVAAHIAKFGNDSVNRRYAWERQTRDLDAITRLPILDLVLGLAAGKRSDIYSWDLLGSQSQGVSAVAQAPRETIAIQKQQRLVAGLRERLERLPA